MLLNFTDISPVKKSVEVEIPAELIESVSRLVTTEFGRQAKIPGFRPGKIPANVVRTRFAKEIQEEVMNRVLPATFREAVAEKGLEPVGDPRLDHIDAFVAGAPMKYKAEFEVKPHIDLGEYKGLTVNDPKVEIGDADVDDMIERLREQASSYRPETERGLAEGDFAMIELTTSGEGIEPETRAGHFQMGEETPLPELHGALFGKMPDETAEFDKTYGEDAKNESFRGKTIHHSVKLTEIRVQEKPEVNDELARSVGGWDSVERMREVIGNDIRKHREAEVLRTKRSQLGDQLLATHHFDVPNTLVEEELNRTLQSYARYLASQGVDLEKAEVDWAKLRDEFHAEAVKRVRRSLILDEIAKKEGIIVSDVEVDAEIRRAANEGGRDFADVKHRMRHDGGYEELRRSLAQERALELVLREAVAGS